MKGNSHRRLAIVLVAMLGICLAGQAFPQDTNQGTTDTSGTAQGSTQQPASTDQRPATSSQGTSVATGQKMELEGVILKRTGEGFTLLDERGQNVSVLLTNNTEVKERKSNPF